MTLRAAERAERARLLRESVASYRAALEVKTREFLPEDWAWMQESLARALKDLAKTEPPAEGLEFLREAVAAMRACLEVYTAGAAPEYHAARVAWIAELEAEIVALEER